MTNTKTMDYETTPIKTGSVKAMRNKVSDNVLDRISTSRIVWHLVKRHKFGLVTIWAVVITVQWAFPPAFDIVRSIIK